MFANDMRNLSLTPLPLGDGERIPSRWSSILRSTPQAGTVNRVRNAFRFDHDSSRLCENLALESLPGRADQILLT